VSKIVLLPIGSFEQHGPHLPINSDNYQIEAVAERVASELDSLLLPVQPLSTCYEHRGKRGSAHYSANVFFKLIVAIAESVYGKGYRNFAALLGHGGIFIAESAVSWLNETLPGFRAMKTEYYAQIEPVEMEHSGENETSRMLYHTPGLVKTERAIDFVPDVPREYLNYGSIFTHSPSGIWGRPSLATKETGERLFNETVAEMLREIRDFFGAGD